MALAEAWAAAKGIAEAVGKIQSVVSKLRAKPDVAATELVKVLDEVAKTHRAVDAAIARYLAIVDDPTAFAQGIKTLLELEGGVLRADVEAGRGHCHEIALLYHQHLRSWFDRALDPTEQVLMKGTFEALGEADYDLFAQLMSVTTTLDQGASEAIDQYRSNGAEAARTRVGREFDELRKLRAELSRTMTSLRTMRIDFGSIAHGAGGA
jgi:hypothetical protein